MRSAQRILAVARVPVIEGHGLGSKARVGICFGVGPLLNLGPSLKADIAATANGVRKGPDRDFRTIRGAFPWEAYQWHSKLRAWTFDWQVNGTESATSGIIARHGFGGQI